MFYHNGDFSGDVKIRTIAGELDVPYEDLRGLVAEQIRRDRIAQLEDATADQLLGSS